MYKIHKNPKHLLVEFEEDFNCNALRAMIHHLTMLNEYPETNDIWVIGKHHANIRMGEVDLMVKEFHCRCSKDAARTKTAVVCDQGLTQAIIGLWMDSARKRVAFEMQLFQTIEEAEEWLGVADSKVT